MKFVLREDGTCEEDVIKVPGAAPYVSDEERDQRMMERKRRQQIAEENWQTHLAYEAEREKEKTSGPIDGAKIFTVMSAIIRDDEPRGPYRRRFLLREVNHPAEQTRINELLLNQINRELDLQPGLHPPITLQQMKNLIQREEKKERKMRKEQNQWIEKFKKTGNKGETNGEDFPHKDHPWVFTQGEGVNAIETGYTEAKGKSILDLHKQVVAASQELHPQPGCSRQVVPQGEPSFKTNLGIKIETPAIGQDSIEDDPLQVDLDNVLIMGEASSQIVKAEGVMSSKRPPERLRANPSKVKIEAQTSKKLKADPQTKENPVNEVICKFLKAENESKLELLEMMKQREDLKIKLLKFELECQQSARSYPARLSSPRRSSSARTSLTDNDSEDDIDAIRSYNTHI